MIYTSLHQFNNKILIFVLTLIVPGYCLPFGLNGVTFIVDYIQQSELQVPFYTVMVCGGQDRNVLLTLSAKYQKLFLLRGLNHKNVTEWNIKNDPQGFILDMACPHAQEILQQADDLTLFRKPYSWLLISKDAPNTAVSNSETIESINMLGIQNKYTRIDSLVVIGVPSQTNEFDLYEVYKIAEYTESIVKNLGKWTEANGLQFISIERMVRRRQNLNGITIPASLLIVNPDSRDHLSDLINVHHDSPTKIAYGIYQSFSQNLNVHFRFIETGSWGALVNGSWNGMVGQLASGLTEAGCSVAYHTPERMEVMEYIHGTPYIIAGFIARAPPLSYANNLFTMPFSLSVWISSFATLIFSSLLLFIANKFECDILKLVDYNRETLDADIGHIALMNVATVCQQGYDLESRGISGRIVTIALYLSLMFLFTSYSASIVALLQSSDFSIQTVQDLLDSPLQCGAEDVPYQRHWLSTINEPVRRALYLKKINSKSSSNFMSITDGIERVRKGLYAFHVDLSAGYHVIQETFSEAEKCGLMELNIFFQVPEPWIPLRKGSPYSEHFKISAKSGAEMGVESRVVRRYYRKKPPCIAAGVNFASVGLMDSYRLFLLLAYGMSSSIILLIIEKLFKKRNLGIVRACQISFNKLFFMPNTKGKKWI